ncbi:hypothetical protein PCL_12692 [Purpureocillium lilacinum]|uniref:Uncharacterized protein n=1 Tax=Purpureocillium lilacinum TaxID=33203 RepID=A0A2U3E716_PURLI|nr:hypothetical protein PCL_12692 [Purpureocillium lilacinum]
MADRFPNTPGQTATDLGQQRPKGRVQRRFKHAAERDGVPGEPSPRWSRCSRGDGFAGDTTLYCTVQYSTGQYLSEATSHLGLAARLARATGRHVQAAEFLSNARLKVRETQGDSAPATRASSCASDDMLTLSKQQQIGHERGGQATASSSRQGWCVHAAYCTLHLGLTDAWALAGTVFTARHMLLARMALPGKAAQILRRQGLLTRHSRRIGPGKAVTLVGRRRTLELARGSMHHGPSPHSPFTRRW